MRRRRSSLMIALIVAVNFIQLTTSQTYDAVPIGRPFLRPPPSPRQEPEAPPPNAPNTPRGYQPPPGLSQFQPPRSYPSFRQPTLNLDNNRPRTSPFNWQMQQLQQQHPQRFSQTQFQPQQQQRQNLRTFSQPPRNFEPPRNHVQTGAPGQIPHIPQFHNSRPQIRIPTFSTARKQTQVEVAPADDFDLPNGGQLDPVNNIIIHLYLNSKDRMSHAEIKTPVHGLFGIGTSHGGPGTHSDPIVITKDFDRDTLEFVNADMAVQSPSNIIEVKATVSTPNRQLENTVNQAVNQELNKAIPKVMDRMRGSTMTMDNGMRKELEEALVDELAKNLGETIDNTEITEEDLSKLIEEGFNEVTKEDGTVIPTSTSSTRPQVTVVSTRSSSTTTVIPTTTSTSSTRRMVTVVVTRTPSTSTTTTVIPTTRRSTTTTVTPTTTTTEWTNLVTEQNNDDDYFTEDSEDISDTTTTTRRATWTTTPRPTTTSTTTTEAPTTTTTVRMVVTSGHVHIMPGIRITEKPTTTTTTTTTTSTTTTPRPTTTSSTTPSTTTSRPTTSRTTTTPRLTPPSSTTTLPPYHPPTSIITFAPDSSSSESSQSSSHYQNQNINTLPTRRPMVEVSPSMVPHHGVVNLESNEDDFTDYTKSVTSPPVSVYTPETVKNLPTKSAAAATLHPSTFSPPLVTETATIPLFTEDSTTSSESSTTVTSSESTRLPFTYTEDSSTSPGTSEVFTVSPTFTSSESRTSSEVLTSSTPSKAPTSQTFTSSESPTSSEETSTTTTTPTFTFSESSTSSELLTPSTPSSTITSEFLTSSESPTSSEPSTLPFNPSEDLNTIPIEVQPHTKYTEEPFFSTSSVEWNPTTSSGENSEDVTPSPTPKQKNVLIMDEDYDYTNEFAVQPSPTTTTTTSTSTTQAPSTRKPTSTSSEEIQPNFVVPNGPCPTPNNPNDRNRTDILFLLDSSDQFDEQKFQRSLQLIGDTVEHFQNFGPNGVQVSLVQYNDEPYLEFSLRKHNCKKHLLDDIADTEYMTGGSQLEKALDKVSQYAFTRKRGDRPDAENVLIIVTDGPSSGRIEQPIRLAQKNNVTVLVISTINADKQFVQELAGNPENLFGLSENTQNLAWKLAKRIGESSTTVIPSKSSTTVIPTLTPIHPDRDLEDENNELTVSNRGNFGNSENSENEKVINLECVGNGFQIKVNPPEGFRGVAVVKGYQDNARCKATATSNTELNLFIPNDECGVTQLKSFEPKGLNSSLVIHLLHDKDLNTYEDKAFLLQCFIGTLEEDKEVSTNLDVIKTELAIAETISLSTLPPTCTYSIRSNGPDGTIVQKAVVGQTVYHTWECDGSNETSNAYGIQVHSCYASDDVERKFAFVDPHGCSSDLTLLSDLHYSDDSLTAWAVSHVFSVHNADSLKFVCKLSLCTRDGDGCEGVTPPTCGNTNKSGLLVTKRLVHGQNSVDEALTSALSTKVGLKTGPDGLEDTLKSIASSSLFWLVAIVAVAAIVAISIIAKNQSESSDTATTCSDPTSSSMSASQPPESPGPDFGSIRSIHSEIPPTNNRLADFMRTFDRSQYV